VPISYFGFQPIGAAFHPRYSFLRDVASELGTVRSTRQDLVNSLVVIAGLIMTASGIMVGRALWAERFRVLAVLGGVVIGSFGAGTIAAGLYPLPHPRHGGGPVGAGAFVLPFLLVPILWRFPAPGTAMRRVGALLGPLLFGVGGFILSDPTRFGSSIEGLGQRILAAGVCIPLIALGFAFRARSRADDC
jgi:hypothetical protein